MILPVVVPKLTGERRGQLIAYPNIRSFKKNLWDTKVVPALARVKPLHRLFRKREVDYQERGAYLFYGYRTLHGVESPAEARSTRGHEPDRRPEALLASDYPRSFWNAANAGFFAPVAVSRPDCQPSLTPRRSSRSRNQRNMSIRGFFLAIP